ncbi:MAG: V-type ATP synthase subunit E [Anaerococcus sp.]|nr:V-type ATP synthase subunit E [Anaerococcus sp.]
MNNLDLILESIIGKGKEEEAEILKKAQDQASKIKEESLKEANERAKNIIEDANKESTSIIENEKVSAQRQARDIKIAAKNDLIDELIERLIEELKEMDENSYKKFIRNSLENYGDIKGLLILQHDMKAAISPSDITNPKIKISEEGIDEGFIIKDGDVIYDNRFSSLIRYNIDDIKKQISDSLFK